MYLVTVTCADHLGVAARITQALYDAGINTQSMRFTTKKVNSYCFLKRTIGEGEIVVRDEDWLSVQGQLEKLKADRKNLDLTISKPYYRVTISIPNSPGALNEELQKLASNQINIRHFVSGDPNADNNVLVRIVFECSPEKYHTAKQLLKNCLQEESPFLATAVKDL